jgi:pimeloyl-ACP methyl ester carboxylesterase
MVKTLDISCMGYAVKTDIYEGSPEGPVMLNLIGRTSRRDKQRYNNFLPKLARELGVTTVIFDYSGHGDSPFDIEDISPAQQFLEVIEVFDWMKAHYPNKKVFVIGSSFGGFLATQLTKYREFDGLILRAPAIYRPKDFYTKKRDENRNATDAFRQDVEALAKHPLLARASAFTGKTLLIVHERDEQVPKETTDAYVNAFKPEILRANVTHSLDDSTPEEINAYNDSIQEWIAKQI